MYQLLESIYLNNGQFRNLAYHQARMNASVAALWNNKFSIDLQQALQQHSIPKLGLYKTRVIYNTSIQYIEFVPYIAKSIHSISTIIDDSIEYPYKFTDRARLTQLYDNRGAADDILIIKNGMCTDTYYGNVIFRRGETWYTPESYLLKGTMRQHLLDTGLIKETIIDLDNLKTFESCKIINSMLGMEADEIPITSIY